VVNAERKAEPRPITIGDWNGNDVFVTNGLRADDQVVVDGGLTLRPGAEVAPKLAAEAPPPAAATPEPAKPEPKKPGG
jgi:membrane fusion protein (multidrug efflux system)